MLNPSTTAEPVKGTVLLVDDDKLVLATFRYTFEQKGYRVLAAEHGGAALQLLETHTPDVVFLDILMPVKEGLETLLEIKQRFPEVPVYVMSGGGAVSKHDFLGVAKKFGATGTIRKPVTPQALIGIIEEARHRPAKSDAQKTA